MNNIDKSRAEFEAWARSANFDIDTHEGDYLSLLTETAWVTWQAALARAGLSANAGQAEPVAKCGTCSGTGFVDDGEIDCYSNGEPFEHGPVKCVKDCPDCKLAAPVSAAPAATAEPKVPEGPNFAALTEGWDMKTGERIAAAPTAQHVSAAPAGAGEVDAKDAALTNLRTVLQEFVDYHTKPAGLTPEILGDESAYKALWSNIDAQQKVMVERAQALLAGTANKSTKAPIEWGCMVYEGGPYCLGPCPDCDEVRAAMSAAPAQPKDTTDTKEKANG